MNKKTIILFAGIILLLTTYWACGLQDPKYVNYVETVPAEQPTLTECQQAALALFATNVNPALLSSCATSGCHNATGTAIGGSNLSTTEVNTNYAVIKAYTGTDANVLFNKISASGQSHGGGDKSADLPLATIQTWTDKEAECAAE